MRTVECRSILCESGICDFALNCYTGCEHACAYCYARFMGRFHHPGQAWGTFVDAKTNAADVLARQLAKKGLFSPGTVFVSSVCDAYQPAEETYQLTRRCLKMLLEAGYEIHVQTKSDLVRRDFDLLSGRTNGSLCMTVTTVDESIAADTEPRAPSPARRIEALRRAAQAGIPVKAFVGPLLPGTTDSPAMLEETFSALANLPLLEVYVDRLNPRWGVWAAVQKSLERLAPSAVRAARAMLFDERASAAYNRDLRERIRDAAGVLKAPLNILF